MKNVKKLSKSNAQVLPETEEDPIKQIEREINTYVKKDNEMSKENAEQLLNSVMQDEKDVQDKVKKQQVLQGGRLEKDW